LRTARIAAVGDRPIFALEHGLDETEAKALASAIHAHIAASAPSRDHLLPWIVYAAELGYRYAGDEYWQTFESETPGWLAHGDRYWIRQCFRSFHREFGGAQPSGPWAAHFSIICWPITHAILPRDLQRQLASILYELRHSFSAELFESPSMLGEFIAARSWDATSRFQQLAQETQLVGQIAAALLLQGKFGSGGLIHPATLRRIGEDLDRERRAREWLRGARRFAEESARVRGLALGRGPTTAIAVRREEARAEVVALGIEPRLILRPTGVSDASWEVTLEIPDLSHLLLRFPRTRDILTGSRCFVAGAESRPLARGRCLYGAPRITLVRWPRPEEVLLQFVPTDPQLDYLLSAECLLRPGGTRLFRIASDGLAYELRGLRVRAGERYVIVSTEGPVRASAHAPLVLLNCQGAEAAILSLPEALNADWEETLRALGLTQAKTIEVWPAGLSAVVWDGEGHGEWLASERPCLAICTDHQIDALFASMSGRTGQALEITPIAPGEPVFVELPQLPVGLHTVRVGARGGPKAEAELLGDLDVVMRIREARPWVPGVSPQGPLVVEIDPTTPTLEQLWEGHADVTIRGPAGRSVKCRAALSEKDGDAPTVDKRLPPIPLPVTAEGWRAHFERHFRGASKVQAAYDTARVCQLEFTADELGAFTLRCDRDFTPLRWAIRRRGREYFVRPLDDTGGAGVPTVVRLAFETPSVEEPLEPTPEYAVPADGGLYVARRELLTVAIIVPPSVRGLDDLQCIPRVDTRERSVESIVRAVQLAYLWGHARLPGDMFSAMRQRKVLYALTQHIFRILGGDNWAEAELAVSGHSKRIMDLKRAVSRRHEDSVIGDALARDAATLATAERRECVEQFASVWKRSLGFSSTPRQSSPPGAAPVQQSRRAPDDPLWLSELALRLASDPAGVETWAGHDLRPGVARLQELPIFSRAARFLVIATDHHLKSRATTGELYARWKWS
jgi:hypothetical protein